MSITILSACIFITYVLFITIKFGVLPSISDSWYKLQALGGVWYSLFTWFCYSLGVTLFFQTNGETALFFLAGAGLIAVGVATHFKLDDDIEPLIHFGGAVCCILSSFAALWIERGSYEPFIAFLTLSGLFALLRVKNTTFWIEILAFLFIILGLLTTA